MKKENLNERQKKTIGIAAMAVFALFSVAVAWFIGVPMVKLVDEPEVFRNWVDSYGVAGRLIFIGMIILQAVVVIIPGEPFEIGAGYAFGAVEGTLLCIVGTVIGSAIVFLLVRTYGVRLVEVFFSKEKILSLKFLQDRKKLVLILFIVSLIPGTPKSLFSYFVGLTPIKLSTWLIIVAIARIPSILTSTVGGNALGESKYGLAILVFAITVVISAIGVLIYKRMSKTDKERKEINDGNTTRD